MIRRRHRNGNLGRIARIATALACALSAFQLAGCVLEKLNTEMKRQVNAEVDQFIAGNEMTTDQRLVAQAVEAMNGGAYIEAEALLDSAVQINPDNRVALLNLGAVYEATRQRHKALQIYTQLADPASRPVAGTGLTDNDVARLASARLAVMQAGRQSSHFRETAMTVAPPAPPPNRARKAEGAGAPVKSAAVSTSTTGAPDSAGKRVLVTLSSHPSEADAKIGWDKLAAKHGAILGERAPIIAPIDRGDGKGAFRLATGPFASAREAATFCDKLLARRVYCLISSG